MLSTSTFFCYGIHGSQSRDEAFVSMNYKLSTMSRYCFSPLLPSDSMGHVGGNLWSICFRSSPLSP